MTWYTKEQSTPFDAAPIEGLWYLHGDILAMQYRQEQLRGQKYPVISFPSQMIRELSDSAHPGGVINIFGALELWRQQSRDAAFADALHFAEEYRYRVAKEGQNGLVITHPQSGNGYRLQYDPHANQIANIHRIPERAMDLLDGVSRAVLPALYSGETLGMNAIAPVKFFTPDSGWTWYVSEYDGEDLFFGLVAGLEVELGYFSVTELESVRGPLGLPIERDLYFAPQTLGKLQEIQWKLRGGR